MLTSTKPPRCKHCRERTDRPGKVLHDGCIEPWLAAYKAKQERKQRAELRAKAKVERAKDRQRKEKLKTVSQWEDECRRVVQKIARIRDRNDGCISCHVGPDYSGQWHGSHYRSVGACSNTQFLLWNIHKACAQCNLHKGGNREFYRPRLIEKIGLERVEWLDAQNNVTKRSGPAYIEYLRRFKAVMGKRLRRMEKANG
jgi:hypothetical protein